MTVTSIPDRPSDGAAPPGRARWGDRLVGYPADRAAAYRRAGEWTDRPLADRLQDIADSI